MNHPYTEADLIRFIRGEMTEDENKRLDSAMQTNESLSEEVESMKRALTALDRQGEAILKERFKKLERKKSYKKWMYLILILLSIMVIGLLVKKSLVQEKLIGPEAIYAKYFEPYRPPVTIRSDADAQAVMKAAADFYGKKDYDQAFEQFNNTCSEVNQEACFYAVLSALYVGNKNYQKAKNNIGKQSPYLSIILWNEALQFLKSADHQKAIKTFEELVERGDYKKSESLEILMQLEKVN